MEEATSKLTISFEDPFWIGLIEREADGRYEVCKITFGAEPKDYDVYDFILKNWQTLKFSPPVKAGAPPATCMNPKRMQRMISRQIADTGTGTKAQQALKLMQEHGKTERKVHSRVLREAQKERKFELRQQKQKEKHSGH